MQSIWMKSVVVLVGLAGLCVVVAPAQTDVAASFYGAFSTATRGNNSMQSPSNAAGGLLELRHIKNSLIGYEVTYAYNRANQTYTLIDIGCPAFGNGPCVPCDPSIDPCAVPVSANAHEVTGDWVASLKFANFKPFALAGSGILFNVPASGQSNPICPASLPINCTAPSILVGASESTTTSTQPVFIYGAGLDWTVLTHIGLRFQYRGSLKKAPLLIKNPASIVVVSTGAFTHTAEPMIGVFFRF